jgi:NADH:ubiquinone oxidoreductase subunit
MSDGAWLHHKMKQSFKERSFMPDKNKKQHHKHETEEAAMTPATEAAPAEAETKAPEHEHEKKHGKK